MQNRTAGSSARRYRDDTDRHDRAIDKLVRDLGAPAEEVARYYYAVLEELKKDLAVRAFLPLLASVRVTERLSGRQRRRALRDDR